MSPRRSPRIAALARAHAGQVTPAASSRTSTRSATPHAALRPASDAIPVPGTARRGSSRSRRDISRASSRHHEVPNSSDILASSTRHGAASSILAAETRNDSEPIQPLMRSASIFQFPEQDPSEPTAHDGPVENATVATLPPGGKPSRKNITVHPFSGFVAPGDFDSGVRRWWRTFMLQLVDAQILDGHRWSDLQCRSIFAGSLTGDAADWYAEVRASSSNLTLATAGDMLLDKYKSQLPEQELLSRIMKEQKRRDETYQQYAQRLLNMTDSLPGGSQVEANARQACHTFAKKAYYRYSDELKSFLQRLPLSMPAAQKLRSLVDHLTYMAESDGRLASTVFTGRASINADSTRRSLPAKRPGSGMGAVVEHKRRRSPTQTAGTRFQADGDQPAIASSIRCFKCKQLGHHVRDCPQRVGHDTTATRLQGSAATALEEDSS